MLEEDIQILIDQTELARDLAKKLLIFKKGDVVESILEYEKLGSSDKLNKFLQEEQKKIYHQNDEQEKPVDVSQRENLELYREIVDEKDTIYNTKKKNNDEKKKKLQEAQEKGEQIEETPLSNEDIYYATRKENINCIKVL